MDVEKLRRMSREANSENSLREIALASGPDRIAQKIIDFFTRHAEKAAKKGSYSISVRIELTKEGSYVVATSSSTIYLDNLPEEITRRSLHENDEFQKVFIELINTHIPENVRNNVKLTALNKDGIHAKFSWEEAIVKP